MSVGKLLGIICIMGGIAGYLHQWQCEQKKQRERVEEFLLFLRKTVFVMETENIKVAKLLENYQTQEVVLKHTLSQIAKRLSLNIYAKGESAWEEVFREEEQNWGLDKETFGLIINAGSGFFGRNRSENLSFLQKSIRELEEKEKKNREQDAKKRKVWVPVGMLGGLMLVILFI